MTTATQLERLHLGLFILQQHAVTGELERLRYPGVGVTTRRLPADEAAELRRLGWGSSSDVDDEAAHELWTFAY